MVSRHLMSERALGTAGHLLVIRTKGRLIAVITSVRSFVRSSSRAAGVHVRSFGDRSPRGPRFFTLGPASRNPEPDEIRQAPGPPDPPATAAGDGHKKPGRRKLPAAQLRDLFRASSALHRARVGRNPTRARNDSSRRHLCMLPLPRMARSRWAKNGHKCAHSC